MIEHIEGLLAFGILKVIDRGVQPLDMSLQSSIKFAGNRHYLGHEVLAHIRWRIFGFLFAIGFLEYLQQRGLKTEDAVSMIVNGFCKQVFKELPMEFAVEAQKLLSVSLEGSVG